MRFGRGRDQDGGPSALAGAALASAVLALVLAARGELSPAILLAMALSVLVAGLLSRRAPLKAGR